MPVASAPANSITVNNLTDALDINKCRLRDAIIAANTNSVLYGCAAGSLGADIITINLTAPCHFTQCKILLNGGLPAVTQDLTINGSGIYIDGNDLYLIFDLRSAVVTLNNLRVMNGRGDFGAGIGMDGTTLILNNVTVSGNHAHSAAGVVQHDGALYVNNSSFLGNVAEPSGYGGAIGQSGGIAVIVNSIFANNIGGSGGAIAALGSSNLDVTASLFDSNGATLWGGGLYLQDSTVRGRVADSLFTSNQTLSTSVSFGGGAIRVSGASLLITSTTLSNNLSGARGGALNVFGGPITITNVTISGNSAKESGGGVYAQDDNPFSSPGLLTFNNATLTNNTADSDINANGDGGGIRAPSGTIAFYNSLIAGNFDTPNNTGPGTKHPDCSGVFASPRYALVGRNDGCVGFVDGSNGNKVGTAGSSLDPLLAPLANNGGPLAAGQVIVTHALLGSSPAFNAANPITPGSSILACDRHDQRRMPRPLGPACDMGAFETGALVWLPLVIR
jgi:predicted outer membrane repeat protein